MLHEDYKKLHEDFMRNHNGTTLLESYMIFTIVPYSVIPSLLIPSLWGNRLTHLLEMAVLVTPITIFSTVLSDYLLSVSLTTTVLFGYIWRTAKHRKAPEFSNKKKLPLVTNYRATINFLTAISILVVDFRIFPRRYAKTENFGLGVMDVGVGSFICANGIVLSSSRAKENFWNTLKSSLPLLLLGLGRFLSVKAIDYHEHVSEYGVHWNFFLTLAFCKIYCYLILKVFPSTHYMYLAIGTAVCQQMLLMCGLQSWVIESSPRSNFISANREGITSILGYVSLYFFSVSLGDIILHSKLVTQRGKSLKFMLLLSSFLWMVTIVLHSTIGVSRRLANIGYIVWVMAYNVTMLWNYYLLDIFTSQLFPNIQHVPFLFKSISKNGLFFFLLANVCTGIVNIIFQTLLIESTMSLYIILAYVFFVCTVVEEFSSKNIILKFW